MRKEEKKRYYKLLACQKKLVKKCYKPIYDDLLVTYFFELPRIIEKY